MDTSWVSKQDAARRLAVSEKTLEKLVRDGQLQVKREPNPRGAARLLVHAGDVERVAGARHPEPQAFVVPATPDGPVPPVNPLVEMLRLIAERLPLPNGHGPHALSGATGVPLSERVLLSPEEAGQLLGVGPGTVRRLVREGRLRAVLTRPLRIARRDLDSL